METSVPGVFVAGDVTGVGGKPLAMLQGRAAGLNILGRLGYLAPETVQARIDGLATEIRREQRFAAMLEKRYRIRPGLLSLMDDDTIVCRCEGVTAGQVRESIEDGARDARGVKNRTRAGMGNCQGRYCGLTVGDVLAQANGVQRQSIGLPPVRLPVVPVLAGDLLDNE
jgi:D-hydroxyproline dehydrogenase subunit alpha